MWLWAKYVRGINDTKHCTAVLRGPYSRRLSAHNPELRSQSRVVLDEERADTFAAVYICGVAKVGYRQHRNYPHNLHAVVLPSPGHDDRFVFERWVLSVEGGVFDAIPGCEALSPCYQELPDEFTTCRIFRWAVCRGAKLVGARVAPPPRTRSERRLP